MIFFSCVDLLNVFSNVFDNWVIFLLIGFLLFLIVGVFIYCFGVSV